MRATVVPALVFLLAASCAVHPHGEREERERAAASLRELDDPIGGVELPAEPLLADYLRTAFHADAGLRMRYWEWRAALERIPQEASPPNPALTFSWLFNDENMKSWDRATLGLTNDPMSNIPPPGKLAAAGRRALEEARAAGLRFEAAKFELQAEVTSIYVDMALHAEMIRLQEELTGVLAVGAGEAAARLRAGAGQVDLLRADTELELARSELETLHAQHPILAARMNAFLGRDPQAPVTPPRAMPEARPFTVRDDEALAIAAERSPELAALAREVAGRQEALELARLARIPDFGLSASVTGSAAQTLGGMLVLPLRREAIRGGIEEAQALLEAARAARARYERDLAASVVLDLVVLRSAERQETLFRNVLIPRAQALASSAAAGIGAGRSGFSDAIEARRALIDLRRTAAELAAEREKALAAIESASDIDVETLMHPRMGTVAGTRME